MFCLTENSSQRLRKILANHLSDKEFVCRIDKELPKFNNKISNAIFKKAGKFGQAYHQKYCSTSLAISAMKTKMTMDYHYTLLEYPSRLIIEFLCIVSFNETILSTDQIGLSKGNVFAIFVLHR